MKFRNAFSSTGRELQRGRFWFRVVVAEAVLLTITYWLVCRTTHQISSAGDAEMLCRVIITYVAIAVVVVTGVAEFVVQLARDRGGNV